MKKSKFFILFTILIFAFWCSATFGQTTPSSERALEVTYPALPGTNITPPSSVKTPVPEYVRYIYYLIVGVGGLFALASLFYGGFRYVTSAGKPDAMRDARDQILAALIGVAILLGSWLILYNINPQLVTLRASPLRPVIPPQFSGILLCKKSVDIAGYFSQRNQAETLADQFVQATDEDTQTNLKNQIDTIKKNLDTIYAEIQKECYLVGGKGNLPDEWDNKIKQDTGQVYIVPIRYFSQEDGQKKEIIKGYGILTFADRDYKGNIHWIWSENPSSNVPFQPVSVKIADISSVIPYVNLTQQEFDSMGDRNVIAYEEVNYNRGVEEKKSQTVSCANLYGCDWETLQSSPRSLDIKAEDRTIVVLSVGESTTVIQNGHVFVADEPNLLKYPRITTINPLNCALAEIIRGGCPIAKWLAVGFGKIY